MEGEKCQKDQECIGNDVCQRCSRPIYRKIYYGPYTVYSRAVYVQHSFWESSSKVLFCSGSSIF